MTDEIIRFREDEDKFFSSSLYVPTRTIYMGSYCESVDGFGETGVNFKMAESVIKSLHILKSIDNSPICLLYNSPGGDVHHGMAIYDYIKYITRTCPVHFFGFGYVRSVGTVICQAASKRYLSENTRFMIHDGEETISGETKTVEAWAKEAKISREQSYEIYYESIKDKAFKGIDKIVALKMIEDWCSHDTIFDAKTAVELGFADEIM